MVPIRKILLTALCLLVLLGLDYLGFLEGMNNYFYDLSFRLRGPEKPLEKILIAAIDEKTLSRLGPWPLQRAWYASLLKKMKAADIVAFDIVLAETSPDDPLLAEAMKRSAPVVLPILINEDLSIEYPSRTFSAPLAGHVHVERGIDGVAREVYHTLYFQGRRLPSFASVIYELAEKRSFPRRAPFGEHSNEKAILQENLMRVNYSGGPGTIPRLPVFDIVQGAYPESYFRGKIVLVGITAMGLVDSVTTPYAESRMGTSGVEVQANIVNNLLLANAIRVVPLAGSWLIDIPLALLLYICFFRLNERNSVLLLIAALLLFSLFTFLAFSIWHIWNPPAATMISFLVLLMLAYLFKLHAAAVSLGATYAAILPHLRNERGKEKADYGREGLSGILSPRGIQQQALVLHDLAHQLIFEKELSDRILLSDLFGVAVFDPEGRLILANRDIHRLCAENAVSLDDRDRFIADLANHVLEKDVGSPAFEQWLQMAAITVSLSRPEMRYLKVDLSLLSVAEKMYSLFILSDITKVKEVELLKGQIVSIVSHELRTPMANIQGFSELLVGSLEGDLKQYAGIVLEESERLTRFINTFLDINRIEEGRERIEKNPVLVSDLLRHVQAEMQPTAKSKAIELRVEAPAEGTPVLLDRNLIEQALLNLIENAIKYSPPDREVILRVSERFDSVIIDVADRGYGIRDEDQSRIFDKFYRANVECAEDVKGSGLGLAFVKQAVEAQGGQVTVQSTFGEGSTFSLIFPKSAPEQA
ncbi:His Kinase A (phospho-acceptor) domain-containing protein [Syntrophus gentianae]|uniref:histidine kinase n=1 Tax=Syntrophus gentianae TaxID=43775 RepID=A0A1H8A0N4_9BACT|nr:CHASE2 domain-containing protein [Syntrophus gentianae]SEM63474.1 His Kinase A (phospho-acceptor) domain-containing protein [Syntrophus gentianae]